MISSVVQTPKAAQHSPLTDKPIIFAFLPEVKAETGRTVPIDVVEEHITRPGCANIAQNQPQARETGAVQRRNLVAQVVPTAGLQQLPRRLVCFPAVIVPHIEGGAQFFRSARRKKKTRTHGLPRINMGRKADAVIEGAELGATQVGAYEKAGLAFLGEPHDTRLQNATAAFDLLAHVHDSTLVVRCETMGGTRVVEVITRGRIGGRHDGKLPSQARKQRGAARYVQQIARAADTGSNEDVVQWLPPALVNAWQTHGNASHSAHVAHIAVGVPAGHCSDLDRAREVARSVE
jgi:hypothetical protein